MKSILIQDTTREERIRIVQQSLSACGTECEFCNGCDNLGGGMGGRSEQPYVDGGKERAQANGEDRASFVRG